MKSKNIPIEKTAVFIGNQRYLSVKEKTSSSINIYIQKRLHSSKIANWVETLELIRGLNKSGCLAVLFLDLDPELVFLSTLDDYSQLWNELFLEIKKCKSLILIDDYSYKSLETGDVNFIWPFAENYIYQNYFLDISYEHKRENIEIFIKDRYSLMTKVIDDVIHSGVDYTFYDRGRDQFDKILTVLDSIEPKFQFNIYVPKGNYKEGLISDFLTLLEDYLQNVAKIPIMIDQIKTEHATIFIFKCNLKISQEELENSIEQFSTFLNLTQNDIDSARDILAKAKVSLRDIEKILKKYSRDYNRMKLDIRHQFEERSLELRHKLEYEMLDDNISNISIGEFGDDQIIIQNPRGVLSPININIFSQPVSENNIVQNYYSEVFNGDITYNKNDREIIELIEKYSIGMEAPLLKSEYNILRDKTAPIVQKQNAWEKIKGFLATKVAPFIGDVAKDIFVDYIKRSYMP